MDNSLGEGSVFSKIRKNLNVHYAPRRRVTLVSKRSQKESLFREPVRAQIVSLMGAALVRSTQPLSLGMGTLPTYVREANISRINEWMAYARGGPGTRLLGKAHTRVEV